MNPEFTRLWGLFYRPGNTSVKRLMPCSELALTVPPWACMMARVMARPRPAPSLAGWRRAVARERTRGIELHARPRLVGAGGGADPHLRLLAIHGADQPARHQ